ncbi:MAG: ketopantoate reductase family protein [Betaproteobacteria bacterium]
MRICVYGAGAVGGHIAARLSASGNEVSVVARGEHLAAIRKNGLKLIRGDQTIVSRVAASEKTADLGPQDFVLVTLKAPVLGAFADNCAPLLGAGTAVAFVQNGIPWWYGREIERLDPGGRLARAVAPRRILGGVAYSANDVVEPGVVLNHVSDSNMIVIGEVNREESQRTFSLRSLLEKAGISSPPVEDIRQAIWGKLAINLGTSSLCTITGANIAELRSDARLKELAARLTAEGKAIARALGVEVERAPQRPGGGHTSGLIQHKPSMLQDYERGRPMEIDSQLMAPLALARQKGVPTPTLDMAAALVAHKAAAKGLYDASGR